MPSRAVRGDKTNLFTEQHFAPRSARAGRGDRVEEYADRVDGCECVGPTRTRRRHCRRSGVFIAIVFTAVADGGVTDDVPAQAGSACIIAPNKRSRASRAAVSMVANTAPSANRSSISPSSARSMAPRPLAPACSV